MEAPQQLDESNCLLINQANCGQMWPTLVLSFIVNRLIKKLGKDSDNKVVEGIKVLVCEGKRLPSWEILPRLMKRYGPPNATIPVEYGEEPEIDFEAIASDIMTLA